MRRSALLVLLLWSGFCCAAADPPAPVVWPKAFSARFETTILELGVFAANSSLHYDYGVPAQRLDFDVCADGSAGPCSVIFNGTAAYRVRAGGAATECCQSAPVGPPPPEWPSQLAYNGTARAGGQDVDVWVGGTPTHRMFHNPATDSMVFLLVEDVDEQWAVQEPFRVGPQDPALFRLPPSCADARPC